MKVGKPRQAACLSPEPCSGSVDALLEQARQIYEQAGEQWTQMRQATYQLLLREGRPMNAYTLADALSAQLGRKMAPNSVYRILHHFMALRLVQRIESQNLFIACHAPGQHHDCIFFFCERCGGATEVEDASLFPRLQALSATQGFSTSRNVVEIIGVCPNCKA
jgi:Fur family transcriptional regulator, zinc uptake regulator